MLPEDVEVLIWRTYFLQEVLPLTRHFKFSNLSARHKAATERLVSACRSPGAHVFDRWVDPHTDQHTRCMCAILIYVTPAMAKSGYLDFLSEFLQEAVPTKHTVRALEELTDIVETGTVPCEEDTIDDVECLLVLVQTGCRYLSKRYRRLILLSYLRSHHYGTS